MRIMLIQIPEHDPHPRSGISPGSLTYLIPEAAVQHNILSMNTVIGTACSSRLYAQQNSYMQQ